MKPEDKVATVEQCKKLVKLGVDLETEKCWTYSNLDDNGEWIDCLLCNMPDGEYRFAADFFPAPDVAELGEVLNLNNGFYILRAGKKTVADLRTKWCDYDECVAEIRNKPTEAQARCAALIWLIENGYLKPEDIKL